MKKHTELPSDQPTLVGTEFDFHGVILRSVACPDQDGGCGGCFYKDTMHALKSRIECDEDGLPGCGYVVFQKVGFNNEDEFKVWQVIKRMGLEDE